METKEDWEIRKIKKEKNIIWVVQVEKFQALWKR